MTPDTPVMDAFEAMQSNGIGRLLVVDSADADRLVGLLTRTDVMTMLEIMRKGGEVTAEADGRPLSSSPGSTAVRGVPAGRSGDKTRKDGYALWLVIVLGQRVAGGAVVGLPDDSNRS